MDNADSQLLCSTGIRNLNLFPFVIDVPGVFLIDAGNDFHQRGFPRAIFSHQRMDLAGTEFKAAITESLHSRKGLGDVFQAKQFFCHLERSFLKKGGLAYNKTGLSSEQIVTGIPAWTRRACHSSLKPSSVKS